MRLPLKLLLLAAVATGLSCGDASGPPVPKPGNLRLELTSPNGTDGALLLHLTGPALAPASITAASDAQQVYARAATSGGVNVAVFGSLAAGPLLRIHVPDVGRSAEYRVTFVEASDTNNALRASLSGYAGQFVKD